MDIQISIIIVHYKTLELTSRCLKSLYESKIEGAEIIIVDNDSNDGAKENILSEFPSIKWITNSSNEGFGRANNLGAKNALGKHLLFLNSDMIVPQNTIESCLDHLEKNSEIGALGPKLLNEDGSHQKSTYRHIGGHQELLKDNLLLDKLYKFKAPDIRAIMGSFLMIPKDAFVQSKGFDPDFFMYCEELDLCDRIADLGKTIVYFDEVHAIHKHGGSSTDSGWSLRQTYLSRALLVYKRKGLGDYILSHWIYTFNFFINFLLMWKLDKNYRDDYWISQRAYFKNWLLYWKIPFKFGSKLGNGKQYLKSA